MDKRAPKFDYIAWWTSIPGIPAGWPEPAPTRAPVITLRPAQPQPELADRDDFSAAA
jgi:hypothetical protein